MNHGLLTFCRSGPAGVKLRQLEPSAAVRGLHHRDLGPDAVERHHAVHPSALDRRLALQLRATRLWRGCSACDRPKGPWER